MANRPLQGERQMPVGPYWYENLGEDEFQRLCQTLIVSDFGPTVTCWPVGQKDGGRDVTRKAAAGDVIYQVKWAKTAPRKTVTWLKSTVDDEADKIRRLVADGATRYVLMTSISGTAAQGGPDGKGSGTMDTLDEELDAYRTEFGLESMECWWRDDIDTRVNLLPTSAILHFAAMLSGTDALRLLVEAQHEATVQTEITSLLRRVLSAQWAQDAKVKFKQAELDNDSLHALFVDVRAQAEPPRGIALVKAPGDLVSFPTRQVGGAVAYLAGSTFPFTLVRGEPGQGKSTMGQYLAQAYRAEFVARSADTDRDRPAIAPSPSRMPLRVDLRDYASWLDGEDPFAREPGRPNTKPAARARGDLERFLQVLLGDLAAADTVALAIVHELLDRFPVAIVLDGLDEVAQPALRRRVVDEIERFIGRYQRGPLMTPKIVVTTRPNVSNLAEPTRALFELLVLDKLDDTLRTEYLRNWCAARGIEKRARRDLMQIFNARKAEPHIAQLTGNPMQLTILLYLLHRHGQSIPDRRTPLYDEYMKTSLSREADKTASVQANRADLEEVTAYLGWHLQGAAEQDNSAGRLRTRQLRSKIFEYLDAHDKNPSLVGTLFTDVTDRVWMLTSKVQGTFEFDVQPVREFFAAKYLAHYATEDKSKILRELIARPFWLNTSRFFAGFATPNEVSGLVDGLADTLGAGRHPLADRITVWTLLADGVFAQRARAQQRAVELLVDDLSVRLLFVAGNKTDSLPAMPADRGAAAYCQALLDSVAAEPTALLAAERVAVAARLGVESPPLGQWWLDHARPAIGQAQESAWLRIASTIAAGRLLDFDDVDTLALAGNGAIADAVAAGVQPRPGSAMENRMLAAVLAGQCGDVAAPSTGLVPDLVNVLAPRELIALAKPDARFTATHPSSHRSTTMAAEKRREAFRRLTREDAGFGKIQAAMNLAGRSPNTVAPWSTAADHLREIYGPCWLAADIAIIGAAIPPDRRRDVGPMDPRRNAFGADVDYGRLVNDVREHRRDEAWWRDQHDQLVAGERGVWLHALLAVADPGVVQACADLAAQAVAGLTAEARRALLASSSRLGLSGVSRRLPAELIADAGDSLPLALMIAHHADDPSSMGSALVGHFPTQQAQDAAAFGAAGWPSLRAAGAAIRDGAVLRDSAPLVEWLGVLAAHGPDADAGIVAGQLDAELAGYILASPSSFPLMWVRAAEAIRSTLNPEPPMSAVGAGWFDE